VQTITVDDPNICQSVAWAGCAKTLEQINVFGVDTSRDPRNIGVPIPIWQGKEI